MLYLESTVQGICKPVIDSVLATITNAVYAYAGPDQTICANMPEVELAGQFTLATGVNWSTATGGTFVDQNTINGSYFPSALDTSTGSVELVMTTFGNPAGCLAEKDTMEIFILPGIYVNAGNDKSMCANEDSTQLSGIVKGNTTTSGIWSTSLGSGTFSDNIVLDSYYELSTQDTIDGNVTLTLTSTNNGVCPAVQDSMILTINDPIIVDAGDDFDICGNNATGIAIGNISGSTVDSWSSTFGTGTFSNPNQLTTSYSASNADTASGSVVITLSSIDNGVCRAVHDSAEITIIDPPKVDAGLDSAVCANNVAYALNGIVFNGTTTGIWSTSGTGNFSPNDANLAAIYTPSNADTLAGKINIILTSTNNGLL